MSRTSELTQNDPSRGRLKGDVPCVDVSRLAAGDAATVASVRAACRQTGFFFLDANFDHNGAVGRVLGQMDAFFGLDDADPRKQAVDVTKTLAEKGWTPLYGELPYQPGTVAHVESFDCGRQPPPGSGDAPNVWPDLPGFRRDVRACWDALAGAGAAVLAGLALAAGLERDYFAARCSSQELNKLRLLHYPQNDAPDTEGNVGIAAHTDFECMTLIMQTAPGLELLAADGSWYDVPCHDGRLVVMLDDMLEHWTNGFFQATGHRVRNTRHRRYSIVMFFAVNEDEVVAPLPAFVAADQPARYPPVRQRDHLASELEKATLNRRLAT
jgi:isopenicillin N synthase-like dioxygenase